MALVDGVDLALPEFCCDGIHVFHRQMRFSRINVDFSLFSIATTHSKRCDAQIVKLTCISMIRRCISTLSGVMPRL